MSNILIVDDEEADLIGLAAMLETSGHEVLLARDAEEALEVFLGRRIHLVVTDMVMPGRDGLSLISALRNVDPGTAIIAISGKSRGQLEASKVFGASKVLAKPIERADFLAAVDEVLDGATDGGAR
jgi:CheY-like chemotaxis protein